MWCSKKRGGALGREEVLYEERWYSRKRGGALGREVVL